MSNRIDTLFENKKQNILSVYFTAGYPSINDTRIILRELQNNGADFVEIGMPYSDPVADGPTIQESSEKALENGMTVQLLFEQLHDMRAEINMPVVLMGYINPVLQYGLEKFCEKCKEVGVDGLILPDLPVNLFLNEYKSTFEKYGIYNIFLITPQSSNERIKMLDANSKGFLYMVSSFSITGGALDMDEAKRAYFERVNSLNLNNPRMVGFGINNKSSFDDACQYASGAIIGSAFVKALSQGKPVTDTVREFVRSIVA